MMRGHVLVVDDSPTGRQAASNLLQRSGYQVSTAVDGEDALEQIAAARPPVVVLDIVLPKMNGYQVLRQLKSSDTTRGIKVILVSSKSQESDRFWGLKQGADDYIAKPYLDDTLLAAVARAI
jgi:twitching motility two-component system response regulator PilH